MIYGISHVVFPLITNHFKHMEHGDEMFLNGFGCLEVRFVPTLQSGNYVKIVRSFANSCMICVEN